MRFRVWDFRRMIYPEADEGIFIHGDGSVVAFVTNGHCNGKGDPEYMMVYDGPVYIEMLSTGLKDKNGKEIYEGDLVRYPIERLGGFSKPTEITFIEGCFILGYKDHMTKDYLYTWLDDIEVIGNKYENPGLLS